MNLTALQRRFVITLLLVVSVVTVFVSLTKGAVEVDNIFGILLDGYSRENSDAFIIWDIRMSRIAMAFITGAMLALSGASLQALLRNPLADPHILGVSGGAALGGILAIVFSPFYSHVVVQFFAFTGALITIFFVYVISKVGSKIPRYKMLLTGVIINAFMSAFIMLILSISDQEKLASSLFWLMGDLSSASWEKISHVLVFVITGSTIIFYFTKEQNLILFGEEHAATLGVEVEFVKKVLFVATSLVTASVVSVCGLIGFVGIIIPHSARLIMGANHNYLLPASLLMGGTFLVISDTIARTIIAPTELPVGVITAILGAPVFVYLMKRKFHI